MAHGPQPEPAMLYHVGVGRQSDWTVGVLCALNVSWRSAGCSAFGVSQACCCVRCQLLAASSERQAGVLCFSPPAACGPMSTNPAAPESSSLGCACRSGTQVSSCAGFRVLLRMRLSSSICQAQSEYESTFEAAVPSRDKSPEEDSQSHNLGANGCYQCGVKVFMGLLGAISRSRGTNCHAASVRARMVYAWGMQCLGQATMRAWVALHMTCA